MADDERDDPPLTVDSLADLQAGLHDNNTAARLRNNVRTDPDAQQIMDALNRVRGDVAALSSDGSSAPEVDPAVVNRIGAALRAQHAVRRGGLPRSARLAVALTGLTAVAVAAWLGTRALITAPGSTTTTRPTTIEHITVSRPPQTIPLSDQQILAVAEHEPDFGPLTDPRRRASCLSGLGYPVNARVLGARPIDIAGHPAVLLVLPGDAPGGVKALAVAPTCSAANTGLSADRMVTRP
jgi:hypothetical protein